MSLKHAISEEINTVFLNSNEFAETITLDNVEVLAIVSSFEVENAQENNGVSFEGVKLSLDMACIKIKYQPHKKVMFNNKPWYCLEVKNDMGLLTLSLYRERS